MNATNILGNEWSVSKLRLQMCSTGMRGLVQECCLLSSNKKLDWILVFRYLVRVRGPPRSNQEAPLRRWIIRSASCAGAPAGHRVGPSNKNDLPGRRGSEEDRNWFRDTDDPCSTGLRWVGDIVAPTVSYRQRQQNQRHHAVKGRTRIEGH